MGTVINLVDYKRKKQLKKANVRHSNGSHVGVFAKNYMFYNIQNVTPITKGTEDEKL